LRDAEEKNNRKRIQNNRVSNWRRGSELHQGSVGCPLEGRPSTVRGESMQEILRAGAHGDAAARDESFRKLEEIRGDKQGAELTTFQFEVDSSLERVFDSELSDSFSPAVLDKYLDFAAQLAERQLAIMSLPLRLFADVFDAKPISECKKYWAILEQKQPELLPIGQLHTRTELLLLKLSNSLLKRISTVIDTEFAGQIQLFLSRLLPLEHKASLNLAGNFHTENVTAFDEPTDNDEVCSVVRSRSRTLLTEF